tara:strand:+ start:7296 stop:10115 length:2820 start_codon:yes stop_codon:yes gene_type:complete
MKQFDLIGHVVPTGGIYNVVGMEQGKLKPKFTDSLEVAYEIAEEFSEQGMDVYFALGKLKEKGSRKAENVESLGAIWLDIDCGGDKAQEIESSTGLPKGYISQVEGLKALKNFCDTVDLPEPVIVNSGYGLHVYWAFTEELPTEQWLPIARRLEEICVTQEFYADPNVFDVSRILRVPNTYNQKRDTPKLVRVMNPVTERYAPDYIRSLLGVDPDAVTTKKSKSTKAGLDPFAKLLQQNKDYSFKKIISRADPCLQLKDSLINRATLSEPRWFNALSTAKFTADGGDAIHAVSRRHPDYDYYAVERKIVGIKGPHSCEEFNKNNPDGCKGCVHKGKIERPFELGKVIKRAPKSPINELGNYFRGENGGVYRADGDDATLIYEHDFYLKKQMWDDEDGFVSVFVFHSPQDGVREFNIKNSDLDRRLLTKALAHNGVLTQPAGTAGLHEYVIKSIQIRQTEHKAEMMRRQFGWADNNTKFVVGEREIHVDGVYHTPASSVTRAYAGYFEPQGTLEKWSEVFNVYNREGMEVHAFAALSGFGSPLLNLTGQKGAIISLVHKNAGTGKTTILRMANSICGSPEELLGQPADTAVARINKLGILNNIVNTMDELSNLDDNDVSWLAYEISQGKGKDKGRNDISANRENHTTWRNISLSTSNNSFYQKLYAKKTLPEGELMRIMEFYIDYSDANIISTAEGKQLFDHQLLQNYGHAIVPFIQYVIANAEGVKNDVLAVQKKIDKELRLTSRERNWSAIVAANITGGIIATKLGLIKFDMERIYLTAAELIKQLRKDTAAPMDSYVSILGAFVINNFKNLLDVKDNVDQRSSKIEEPALEPTWGRLVMRHESDTKKLFIPVKELRNELNKDGTDYKAFISDLKQRGIYLDTVNKRMSKGMIITSPAQRCAMFDAAHPEFIDMSRVVEKAKEDADREGGVPDQLEEV